DRKSMTIAEFILVYDSRVLSLFLFSSRRRHTRWPRDWSSDVCSSDLSGEVSRQLQAGMKLIQSAQATMGDRLDSAAKVVGEVQRSEERRVGKGCRYRWCYDQSRKIAWLPSA